ncbi:hypothetical protein K1719_023275 [Acacia pycnantha]|nr:hypothetical protein K1719_023275 [Acacia pycnantha]
MAGIVEGVVAHVGASSADKAMQELKYLCCYKSYVDDFEKEKTSLSAKRDTVRKDIKEAKDKNEDQTESEVELWLREADALINEDTKGKKKWFGLVPNCFWQYNRGKDLEDKKQRIQKLVQQSNKFTRVARSTGLPGIKFYYTEHFMQLKDRELKFRKLTEALKNGNKFVIGLYGLGGTGKTTMAKEVGKEVAESKVFDKVIFSVVSKDANLKRIRDNIATHLNLPFKEGTDESEQAQELWKRIAEGGEKVLLILDDVWKELSLEKIGIPRGRHGNRCCSILLTTRDRGVCSEMGCHESIELEVLSETDAVDLFLSYADKSTASSSNGFKDVVLGIVNECGSLPVAIVAVARALKSKPLTIWNDCLKRLRNPKSIHDVQEDLKEAYNSLRLSYDYLENKEAKQLFLVCSLFPDDYEIPTELLTRIAIGMGLCGGADKYFVARSYFTPIKDVLMDSCLLIKAKSEAVKMHDLVREVALWIGNKQVQLVMDSRTTVMENIQYSSWNINDFPSHFDGGKLEVLLLWISNDADSITVKVPDGIFERMENFKILALMNWSNSRISGAFLFQSHPSLINVRSLAIKGFELGDISFLINLKSLESLELSKCSMIELPKEIRELEKLRLLEMVQCNIERNNPFEVIGSCLQLEELYFVSNKINKACELERYQIKKFPKLERYQMKGLGGSYYEVDFSISRYFNSECLRVKFSVEIFKSLMAGVEVLKLEGQKIDGDYSNRGWTNVVPDILPVKDDNMEDHLTRLCLRYVSGIKCLICKEHLRFGVAIFSKLVELELYWMGVRELCCVPYPINFLKQLEKLYLSHCKNLEGSLFDGELELYERDLHQMGREAILQSLEELKISGVPKFINLYAECYLPCLGSDKVQKSSPSINVEDCTTSLSRGPLCCFWAKSNASTIYHPSPFTNHNEAMKYVVSRAHGLFTPPLYPYTLLRRLEISELVGLKSLFTLSTVSSLKLLEILTVLLCDTLEHIVIDKEDDHDHMNVNSIFHNLREVKVFSCSNLEYLFPAFYSKDFKDLESLWIRKAEKLTHVFGKCQADQNHDVPIDLNLPALKQLFFQDIPNIVSICAQNYSMKELYLEDITLERCPQLPLETLIDLLVAGHKRQEDLSRIEALPSPEEKGKPLYKLTIRGYKQLKFIFSASTSRRLQKLRDLKVEDCEDLVSIIEDQENNKTPMAPHQVLFPGLRTIKVRNCKSMEYLFSISSGELPRLLSVNIDNSPQLGEVFRWNHGEGQKLVMEDVFPKLYMIRLVNLPTLHTICQGIDFQTLKFRRVRKCPAISLTSANESYQELHEFIWSFQRNSVHENEDVIYVKRILERWKFEAKRERVKAMIEAYREREQNHISPKLSEIEAEGSQQDIRNDLTMPQRSNGSPKFKNSEEVSKEIAEEDSTINSNLPNLTKSNKTSANEIVEEKLSTTPSSDLDMSEEASKDADEKDSTIQKQESSSPNLTEVEEKGSQEYIGNDSTMPRQNNAHASPNFEKNSETSKNEIVEEQLPTSNAAATPSSKSNRIEVEGSQQDIVNDSTMPQQNNGGEKVSKEITEEDSTTNSNLPNLTKSTKTSANEIVEEKLSTTPSSDLDMNLKATFGEGLSSEKYGKASSSKESMDDDQQAHGESRSSNEVPQRIEEPTKEWSSKETSNEVLLKIPPPSVTEMTYALPPTTISTAHTEPKSPQSDMFDISINTEGPQVEIMTNDETCTYEEEMKFDQKSSCQIFEEHDLMRLFQMMKEGADMKVDLSYVSKLGADLHDNKEVTKALADLEASLKKGLNEIACSEENRHRLQNALNILCSHCSEDGASSHGLQDTIQSLQQEIQTVLSSFNQAYATIDTFTKLEQKEKLMIEQRSQREKDAKTLLYDINTTKNSIAKVQLNELELKEQISKLQVELRSKEEEIEEYKRKLLSLQEQEKKSVSDTIGFTMEFLAMEKERSCMMEDQMKARQQLKNMEAKWSSCLSNLKKTMMLLGVHLKQKL